MYNIQYRVDIVQYSCQDKQNNNNKQPARWEPGYASVYISDGPSRLGRLLSNNYYYMCSKLIDKGRKRLTALPACSREYFITHKLNLKKKKKKKKQRMRQSLSLLYAAISCINLHFNASSSTHKLILLCRWGCC